MDAIMCCEFKMGWQDISISSRAVEFSYELPQLCISIGLSWFFYWLIKISCFISFLKR